MNTTHTITCYECGFCTDVEDTDENAPTQCPVCGDALFYDGTDIEWPENA